MRFYHEKTFPAVLLAPLYHSAWATKSALPFGLLGGNEGALIYSKASTLDHHERVIVMHNCTSMTMVWNAISNASFFSVVFLLITALITKAREFIHYRQQ